MEKKKRFKNFIFRKPPHPKNIFVKTGRRGLALINPYSGGFGFNSYPSIFSYRSTTR
jgi:hypothetical protein